MGGIKKSIGSPPAKKLEEPLKKVVATKKVAVSE
jgi:hypothetical protein